MVFDLSKVVIMPKQPAISASQEDYLETIYHIAAEKRAARANDIAKAMNVKASSVTGALRILADKGLINYAPYDLITLTAEGESAAQEVVRRHEVLNDFFSRILGISSEDAETAACEMEHALPQAVLNRLIQFIQFLDLCPRAGSDWIDSFRAFCRDGVIEDRCVACTFQSLESLKAKRSSKLLEGSPPIALPELPRDQMGRIVKIRARGSVRTRLSEMDLTPGVIVEMERIEGDEVEVRVKGYHRLIRLDDAERVLVDVL